MSYSTYCQSFFHPLFLSPCLLTGCSGNNNTLYNIIYFQLPHIFVISTSGSTYQLHTFSIITSHFIVIQPLRNGRPLNSYITKFTLHRHKPFFKCTAFSNVCSLLYMCRCCQSGTTSKTVSKFPSTVKCTSNPANDTPYLRSESL